MCTKFQVPMKLWNVGTHCFVYWEEEDAGSIVDVGSVENKPVVAGIVSNVTNQGKKHLGKIAAVG